MTNIKAGLERIFPNLDADKLSRNEIEGLEKMFLMIFALRQQAILRRKYEKSTQPN